MIPYQMILVFNVVREKEKNGRNFIVVVGVYFLIGRSDLVWILLNILYALLLLFQHNECK